MLTPRSPKMSPRSFRLLFTCLLLISDIAVSYWVIMGGYELRVNVLYPPDHIPPRQSYVHLACFFTVVNIYFMYVFGMYRATRIRSSIDELFGVIKSVTVTLSVVLAMTFFYRDFEYSRLMVVLSFFIGYFMLGTSRGILVVVEGLLLRSGYGRKKALFVGTGDIFEPLVRKILDKPETGYNIIGYLEEEPGAGLAPVPLIGRLSELDVVVDSEQPDEVFVTLKTSHHEMVEKIVDVCDRKSINCTLAPDLVEIMAGPRKFDEIEGIPLIRVKPLWMKGANYFLKRTTDFVLSVLISILLFPLIVLLSIIVKLDTPGPIFYLQKRVGMDGVEYWMFKFRTMPSGAEGGAPAWSDSDDPRATRAGRFLRKASLDELPQLLNVLLGQMSLVGPRPERPFFVQQFKKDIPRYMERHKAKAGMTGWAQVNGLRGDTSLEDRIRYDMYYIENWSIGLDIKILMLTIKTIITDVFEFFLSRFRGDKTEEAEEAEPQE